jgi:energy-coupling factor transporter ATP-binding protein EcfA2
VEPVKIEFKNYKKLTNDSFDFGDSNIYIVVGSNDRGKTTFLEGLETILQAKNEVKVPVTTGEKTGEIKFLVKSNEGKLYTASFKFDNDGGKFVLTSEDGLSATKVTQIRDFFSHETISAEDFIRLGNNEKDRKKQRDIFLKLLDEEAIKEFQTLEEKLETKMAARKTANLEVATLSKTISGSITPEEISALEKKQALEQEAESIRLKKEAQSKIKANLDVLRERLKGMPLESGKDKILEEKAEKQAQDQKLIDEVEEEIKLLQIKLENRKKAKIANELLFDSKALAEEERLKNVTRDRKVVEDEIKAKETASSSIVVDETRAAEVETLINSMASIASRAEMVKTMSGTLEVKQKEATDLNNEVDVLRADIGKVIARASELMPKIAIHSDGLYYKAGDKEIPFLENQVGTAEIYKVTIQILLALNKKTPIIVVGRGESIDNNNLEEINQMIESWNKEKGLNAKLIVDRVLPNDSPIRLVAYEELDNVVRENLK